MLSDEHHYGQFYWCIGVDKSLGTGKTRTEIYLYADGFTVGGSGELIMMGGYRADHGEKVENQLPVLVIPAGLWKYAYAASCLDGAAVAVTKWDGQVLE
jgi:hypothetical protein